MSAIVGPSPVLEPSAAAAPQPRPARRFLMVGAAVAVLAVAGGVRTWQGNQVASRMESGKLSPFPLKDLPKVIGPWRMTDDPGLDPLIARSAGSTDSISRTYADDRTGVRLAVLVLYGPAMGMQIHKPEKCYPVNGYIQALPMSQRPLDYPGRDGSRGKAEVRTLVYAKGEGPAAERKQVTYTWGCLGRWSSELPATKAFHRIPGMFKVHIDRQSAPGESGDADAPAEAFLRELLPEIDARIRTAAKTPAATTAVTAR